MDDAWLLHNLQYFVSSTGPSGPAEKPAEPPDEVVAEISAREPVKHLLVPTTEWVGWDQVVGQQAACEALREAIEAPLLAAGLYDAYGLLPPKGVLLCGPPGCGKTMLAKAAATALTRLYGKGETPAAAAPAALLMVRPSDWQTRWWGETERLIAAIFAYARAYRARYGHPLTIFMDEADAALPSRSGIGRRPLPWEESQVATFLAEMDGLAGCGAFVILATNRPEMIDSAVLRDGRCDRKITVGRPSGADLLTILARALASVPTGLGVEALARAGTEALLSPLRQLQPYVTSEGTEGVLSLADIVSGAMAEGLARRIRAAAFRRDRAAGAAIATGATLADVAAAVDELERENRALPHLEALVEVGTRLKATWIAPRAARAERPPAISPEDQRRMMN